MRDGRWRRRLAGAREADDHPAIGMLSSTPHRRLRLLTRVWLLLPLLLLLQPLLLRTLPRAARLRWSASPRHGSKCSATSSLLEMRARRHKHHAIDSAV